MNAPLSATPKSLKLHKDIPGDVARHAQDLAIAISLAERLTRHGIHAFAEGLPIHVANPKKPTDPLRVVGGLITYYTLRALAPEDSIAVHTIEEREASSFAQNESSRLLAQMSLIALNPFKDLGFIHSVWSSTPAKEIAKVYAELPTLNALCNHLDIPKSRHRSASSAPKSSLKKQFQDVDSEFEGP